MFELLLETLKLYGLHTDTEVAFLTLRRCPKLRKPKPTQKKVKTQGADDEAAAAPVSDVPVIDAKVGVSALTLNAVFALGVNACTRALEKKQLRALVVCCEDMPCR